VGLRACGRVQAVLHVPLIIRAPVATMHGRHVSDPVRLVDIVPTVLDLLHQPELSHDSIDGSVQRPCSACELHSRS
jgi:arylsulfatase A-like enzyme